MQARIRQLGTHRWVVNGVLIAMMVLIGLLAIAPGRHGMIVADGDFIYHLNRVEAFRQSIVAHQGFSLRNFVTFNQIGVANNYFYPYVFMWLAAWPFVWFSDPITAYYVDLFLLTMLTILITYFCTWLFTRNRFESGLVTVLYVTGPYHVVIAYQHAVFAEALGFALIPLFFLGVYRWLRAPKRAWWLVAVVLALTTYAHLISLLFEIGLLTALYLGTLVKENRRGVRFVSGLKMVALYLLLTAFFWVPFMQQWATTAIQTTVRLPQVAWLNDFGSLLVLMANNGSANGLVANPGWFALVALGLIALTWRRLDRWYRGMAVIGMGLLVLSTSLFPWYALPLALQNVIQFPYRLYSLVSFCLIVAGVRALALLAQRFSQSGHYWSNRQLVGAAVIGFSLMTFVGLLKVNNLQAAQSTPYTAVKRPTLKHAFNVRFKLDRHNFRTLFVAPRKFFGTIDYAPKVTWQGNHQDTLLTHQVLNGRQRVASQMDANVRRVRYQFKLKRAAQVDVPVLHYGNETVRLNGRVVQTTQSKRGSTLIAAKAGHNVVTVRAPLPLSWKILTPIAGLTWLSILGIAGWQWRKRTLL